MINWIKQWFRNRRNALGSSLGYSGCPNCGDSWSWKAQTSVVYETVYGILFGNKVPVFQRGVMICCECASNPDQINPNRIQKDLLQYGWKSKDVSAAVMAISAQLCQ